MLKGLGKWFWEGRNHMNHNDWFLRIFAVAFFVGCVCALAQISPPEQNTNPTSFAPLEQWKNAILAKDAAALTALYSTAPAAQVSAPGDRKSADADVDFWLGLK